MTDNTNIEALLKLYCDAWQKSFEADNPYDTVCMSAADAKHIEAGLRAALSNAEPVARVSGYFGGQCVVVPINPAVALPVNAALFLHPNVPAPLSEQKINDVMSSIAKISNDNGIVKGKCSIVEFARAIEQAHGITNLGLEK